MSTRPWSKFFWNDWRGDPRIRACSLAAQGLWMQMLCIAADADPIGYVTVGARPMGATDLARQTGASEAEVLTLLDELDRNGVFSRDRRGCIYNRRMVRDARIAIRNQRNGKKGGNPTLLQHVDNNGHTPTGITDGIKPRAKSQKLESSSLRSEDKSSLRSDGGFDEFYQIYPRHVAPDAARKAWKGACKKAAPETIIEGARRYAAERAGQDKKFTAHPATWLNHGRWADGDEDVELGYRRDSDITPEEREAARIEARKALGIFVAYDSGEMGMAR